MPNKNFKSNKDGSKLNQKYINEQQRKPQVFFAKHQDKASKAQKAQTETVDAEFLDILQVIINHPLSPEDTNDVKALPQLNSGNKASVSMCGGNDDRDIFNAIPRRVLQKIAGQIEESHSVTKPLPQVSSASAFMTTCVASGISALILIALVGYLTKCHNKNTARNTEVNVGESQALTDNSEMKPKSNVM